MITESILHELAVGVSNWLPYLCERVTMGGAPTCLPLPYMRKNAQQVFVQEWPAVKDSHTSLFCWVTKYQNETTLATIKTVNNSRKLSIRIWVGACKTWESGLWTGVDWFLNLALDWALDWYRVVASSVGAPTLVGTSLFTHSYVEVWGSLTVMAKWVTHCKLNSWVSCS